MTELQLLEKWLPEYFEARHKTWPLRNDADLTPAGKKYCKDQMRGLIRRTIAKIRELRANEQQQIKEAKGLYEFNRQQGRCIETCLMNTAHYLGVPSTTVWDWYQDGHLFDDERVEQRYEMLNTLRDAGYTPAEAAEILMATWN